MKKIIVLLLFLYIITSNCIFARSELEPIKYYQMEVVSLTADNPKGKIKIRFIRNEDKSDTTNKPKGFFGKLKNVVNMLLDASDNPPFKVEIIREKGKKS